MRQRGLTDRDREILERMRRFALPCGMDEIDPGKRRYVLRKQGYCEYRRDNGYGWNYMLWHLTDKGRAALAEDAAKAAAT